MIQWVMVLLKSKHVFFIVCYCPLSLPSVFHQGSGTIVATAACAPQLAMHWRGSLKKYVLSRHIKILCNSIDEL